MRWLFIFEGSNSFVVDISIGRGLKVDWTTKAFVLFLQVMFYVVLGIWNVFALGCFIVSKIPCQHVHRLVFEFVTARVTFECRTCFSVVYYSYRNWTCMIDGTPFCPTSCSRMTNTLQKFFEIYVLASKHSLFVFSEMLNELNVSTGKTDQYLMCMKCRSWFLHTN